jgi:hypothetical protein
MKRGHMTLGFLRLVKEGSERTAAELFDARACHQEAQPVLSILESNQKQTG